MSFRHIVEFSNGKKECNRKEKVNLRQQKFAKCALGKEEAPTPQHVHFAKGKRGKLRSSLLSLSSRR